MTLRKIPVRKRLHELDRTRSSYPTVARTGDSFRRGKYPLIFDDTNTVIFSSNTAISYPTTFQTGSKYLSSDLMSDITITTTGTVNQSAIEPWIVRTYQAEDWVPFKEANLFEYDILSSSYYLTGSRVEDVGLGFSSRLGSKTIIRFELPLTGTSTLLATTASSYYYDTKTKKFEAVNTFRSAYTFNIYGGELAGALKSAPQPREEKLFGPFGKNSTNLVNFFNGSTYLAPATLGSSVFFVRPNGYEYTGIGSNDENGKVKSFLSQIDATANTTPSGSQQLYLSGIINQPFLLEKCIVEFPFQAGSGWFNDVTMVSAFGDNGTYYDIGGPAITVGLLNYFGSGDTKDIILSGTIIPERDNKRNLRLNYLPSLTKKIRSPEGFKSFSEPSFVVKEPVNSQFTGSVRLALESKTSTGISSLWAGPYSSNPVTYPSATFNNALIFIQNIAGRSKKGDIENLAGRSIFGRVSSVPKLSDSVMINRDLYIASGTTSYDDIVIYNCEKDTPSPYLLMPNDRLVLTLSKYRSAYVSASAIGNLSPTGIGGNSNLGSFWSYQSCSHDVAIPSGIVKLTLYGSMVRENEEYHDTLNSRLDTDQVHEAIGMEPIVDQFDVFYSSELTGSYIDQLKVSSMVPYTKMGSIFAVASSTFDETVYSNMSAVDRSWSNNFLYTRAKTLNEIRKRSRNTVHTGDELFWDTRIPDPKSAFYVCNPGFCVMTDDTYGSSYKFIYSGLTSSFASGPGGGDTDNGIGDWYMSFPYEPKFSSISSKFSKELKKESWNVKRQGTTVSKPEIISFEKLILEVGTSSDRFVWTEGTLGYAGGTDGIAISEFVKVVYGFGKGRSTFDNTYVTARSSQDSLAGSGNARWCAEIRGWRHGMHSAFPIYTTAVFRRDRYGQMRDMLEQRIDGCFYSELKSLPLDPVVNVKFVNSNGNIVRPYETYSSNLSTAATSSIPYFDAIVKNREDPISLANTNQTIVVI